MRTVGVALLSALALAGCGATQAAALAPESAADLLQVHREAAPAEAGASGEASHAARTPTAAGALAACYRCPKGPTDDEWRQPVAERARCARCQGRCIPVLMRVEGPTPAEVAPPAGRAGPP